MPRTAPDISSYGLISDCHTAALVSRDGSIDWCCLPRYDSGSAFGRLLDPRAGECVVTADDATPSAREYLDGTLVLATTLDGAGVRARVYDCFAIDEENDRRRLLRIVEGERGELAVRMTVRPRFDYGDVQPLLRDHGEGVYTAVGGDDGLVCWSDAGLADDGEFGLEARAVVRAGSRVRLVLEFRRPETLDGSPLEPPDAGEVDGWLEQTIEWWREWSSELRHSGPHAAGARRSAVVLKGLSYAPTGAIVAAATTSLPESPDGHRTWDYRYCWVRDAVMASRSLAELGHDAEADGVRRFIERSAAGRADDLLVFYGVGGERRAPELELDHLSGRDGGTVRVGNAAARQFQLDVLGFLVEQSWRWHERGHAPDDADWGFIVALVDVAARRWSEPDRGIWEWRGEPRHFVHSKAQCWAALDRGLALAEACGREAPEARWRSARDDVREAIDRDGFDAERGTFLQAFGHPQLDGALLRLPAIGLVPYDDPRMVGTVDAVRDELEEDGLLRRYDLDDELPGREGTFLACTFWLVDCLAHQGRLDDARRTFERACATANDLGLFAEEYDPGDRRMLGNFPQALTHLAHIDAALALAAAESPAKEAGTPA